MSQSTYGGAVEALLAENEKAIHELQRVIGTVSKDELAAIVDPDTPNPDCVSIQTVLTHLVGSGFSYCVYVRNHRGGEDKRPQRKTFDNVTEYIAALDNVNAYTKETYATVYDHELEVFDDADKILTGWGQRYDMEQLMEHAIVHLLRHRRQIESFKEKLKMV